MVSSILSHPVCWKTQIFIITAACLKS
ncbi:hypothetical protein rv5_gp224 [Escherichia phage V5]|uniref:Uncharacterized protein n=1 Tax=Escherichia phage V5 TaxID=399183 RepID=B3RH13_9CAUD|nr:hypothetical protein rv5_gp224 [Escherichia phage V5]ABI79294.1 hypothetical protein [Escherichia phage V5]